MVNTNTANAISGNSYSSINNAIYHNFITGYRKGPNNENINPNIGVANNSRAIPRKYKIINNQEEIFNLSHSNFNLIKNTSSNTNINDTLKTSVTKTHYNSKYNNRRLNFEILTRIFLLSDDPMNFSLVCRQWYYVTRETSTKLLWFINRIHRETICLYLFTHPIYHVHLDSKFLKILLKRGAKLDLQFLEQAIPILLKNKNDIWDGEELGIPSLTYTHPILYKHQKVANIVQERRESISTGSHKSKSRRTNNNSKENEMEEYVNNVTYKNKVIKYYQNINKSTTSHEYHYHPSLLPLFLFLYQKSKKQYIDLVDDINNSLKQQIVSLGVNQDNQFLIEDYQPIISFNESSISPFTISAYKNDFLIPMAILESMFSSSAKTFENHETLMNTIIQFYNEIKNNSAIMPVLKNYLHRLVYTDHFIPYNIIKKPYSIKQIRSVLQFMEVVWILEPEIIFTWIEWGWSDLDGEIPLVLFSAYYDCRSLDRERIHNQSLRELLRQQISGTNDDVMNDTTENHHHHHHHSSPINEDIISRINTSQSRLLDCMWEKNLTISNETLFFIMDSNTFNCSCYDIMGHSSDSPCRLETIIKYWKLSNDRESKLKLVRRLAYKAWSRKDGVGLYKMEYYLTAFNEEGEILLNINEFIIEMITMDPSVIFKQDMLGWIINHSNSPQVKKLILYTLFITLPENPQHVQTIKLILNFVGDIDLKAIQLLRQIDKDHEIWEELYSILIIHLYRRYVRRRISLDTQFCEAWADLFLNLNLYKFELTSVQTRFQDELFELLDIY